MYGRFTYGSPVKFMVDDVLTFGTVVGQELPAAFTGNPEHRVLWVMCYGGVWRKAIEAYTRFQDEVM
jgi:hypothetical protein